MAKLISVLSLFVLVAALGLYANFVLRRVAGVNLRSRVQMPWPRGWRLVVYWLALVISVVILVPGAIITVGYAFGLSDCPADFSPHDPWRCSLIGRLCFLVGAIAVGLPLAALCARLLGELLVKHD